MADCAHAEGVTNGLKTAGRFLFPRLHEVADNAPPDEPVNTSCNLFACMLQGFWETNGIGTHSSHAVQNLPYFFLHADHAE